MKVFCLWLVLMTSTQAQALGLAGAYPEGGSQLELQQWHAAEEVTHGLLLGYGFSHWLNPALMIDQIYAGGENQVQTGVGSISAWRLDQSEVTFTSAYMESSGRGVLHLCGEMSYEIHPRWTPYGRFQWEPSEDRKNYSESYAGLRWNSARWDVLIETEVANRPNWVAGVNWRWGSGIEMNVEGELFADQPSWGVVMIFQPGE